MLIANTSIGQSFGEWGMLTLACYTVQTPQPTVIACLYTRAKLWPFSQSTILTIQLSPIHTSDTTIRTCASHVLVSQSS